MVIYLYWNGGNIKMQQNNINAIIENFFLCTHIPVQAVDLQGTLLHSTGFTKDFQEPFQSDNVFETLKDTLENNQDKPFITITLSSRVNFTGCYICPKNTYKGLFILGPYSSNNPVPIKNLVHKPNFCIPHIVSLLYDLRNSVYTMQEEEVLSNSGYSSYIKEAIEFIHNNFHKPIALENIATHIKINKCYFCNLFKKETGSSFSEFLNHVRIEKSKELLLDRSASVLEVSLSVGFNNQNYFNTVFKRLTNKTPMEFRNSFG
jgi:AraC-like DNA-binding protein